MFQGARWLASRHYAVLVGAVVVLAVFGILSLGVGIRHIRESLPIESLHKQRDFSALLLDVSRLQHAVILFNDGPSAERLEKAQFALELAILRTQDNKALYRSLDDELSDFHPALDVVLGKLEQALSKGPVNAAPLPQLLEELGGLLSHVQSINDAVFQASVQQATAQRSSLEELRWVLVLGVLGSAGGALVLVHSLLRQKRAYAQLHDRDEAIRSVAYSDHLTGLANRRLLLDRLAQALAGSSRHGQYGAVLFMDLDHFKTLNDTEGHDVGDQLLVQVAQRLKENVRSDDTVARLGGDEFVIMLERLGTGLSEAVHQAETVAEKIRARLNQPYHLPGSAVAHHTSPSIGVAMYLGQEESVEVLLKQADLALYQAKDAGRDAVRFFNPAMQADVENRSRMENALRRALVDGELLVHYQPQVAVDGQVVGAEALIRWHRPGDRLIMPAEFIEIAEECGLIVPMGEFVLQNACKLLRRWADRPDFSRLVLSVNVSARQFRHPDFLAHVRDALTSTGAPAHRLKLELTESVVLSNVADTRSKMLALRDLGISLSLDDFGTGYASLSYLKQLPFSQVKIDQSFVRDIGSDGSDEAICAAVIYLAHQLGMEVVAEGVETVAQRDFLTVQHRCNLMQGYLFGAPMALSELENGLLEPAALAA
jgi:diguanylate cyclase (GGDEF)-like protein